MGARSGSHPLCTGKPGNRSMSFCQHSTMPQHLCEVIGQFTEWKMPSKGSNTSFCKRNIYLVLRCSEETRQSSFFFFLFFFEVIHFLLRLQVNRLQNDSRNANVVFSWLHHWWIEEPQVGSLLFALRTLSKEVWSFHTPAFAIQMEQRMPCAHYLCLSVPGSEVCLAICHWCLLFPSFAAELCTAVLMGKEREWEMFVLRASPQAAPVPSPCFGDDADAESSTPVVMGEQSIPQWVRAAGFSPACGKRRICTMLLLQ